MLNNYLEANKKIQTPPELRRAIIEKAEQSPKGRGAAYKAVPAAIAAALVIAFILTAVIPGGGPAGFTVAAAEVELNGKGFTPVNRDFELGMGWENAEGYMFHFTGLPLRIIGDDIATITYEVEGGALAISPECEKLLEGSERYEDFPDTAVSGNYGDVYRKAVFDYRSQFSGTDSVYLLSLRGYDNSAERELAERFDRYTFTPYEDNKLIEYVTYKKVMDDYCSMVFDGTVLHITVRYNNGAVGYKDVKFSERCEVEITNCTGDLMSYNEDGLVKVGEFKIYDTYENDFTLYAITEG